MSSPGPPVNLSLPEPPCKASLSKLPLNRSSPPKPCIELRSGSHSILSYLSVPSQVSKEGPARPYDITAA
jgi:hypothetical protein